MSSPGVISPASEHIVDIWLIIFSSSTRNLGVSNQMELGDNPDGKCCKIGVL
jgi:hypothetical protein